MLIGRQTNGRMRLRRGRLGLTCAAYTKLQGSAIIASPFRCVPAPVLLSDSNPRSISMIEYDLLGPDYSSSSSTIDNAAHLSGPLVTVVLFKEPM